MRPPSHLFSEHSLVKCSLICGQIWHTHEIATEQPTCHFETIKIDSTIHLDVKFKICFVILKHHLES